MRKSSTTAALLVSAAACLVAVSPASASTASDDLCMTVDATPAYQHSDFTGYLFTLSAGRGFRYSGLEGVDSTITGYYGHGAEHPDREVWVRAQHLSC